MASTIPGSRAPHGSAPTGSTEDLATDVAHLEMAPAASGPLTPGDWGLGPITGHRLTVICWTVSIAVALYVFQVLVWPLGDSLRGPLGTWMAGGSVVWLLGLPAGILGLIGTLSFRHPAHLHTVRPIEQQVCFRVVSRGTNRDALRATVNRCLTEMAAHPMFDFSIEVVVDEGGDLPLHASDPRVRVLVVPRSYVTQNGSMFKARALQFALETSPLPDDTWLVHLDEETHPTWSGIRGIAEMIHEEEGSGRLRVGQGAILYHRNWRRHPIMTLADMHRTGDDFARFHFQHRLGITLFGMHGSFIVVRNDVEKQIGFDFGPDGSLTEDAFWALKLMESGVRSRWVHGYLEEQSTQGWRDFVLQRKRWFQGLILTGFRAPTALRWRLPLLFFTLLWGAAPLALLYTMLNILVGSSVHGFVRVLADISFASFFTLYIVGLRANLDEAGISGPLHRFGWLVLQLILVPIFGVIESLAVIAGAVAPAREFHVVKK